MKQETIDRIITFRDERNWKQFHTAKELSISLMLEAGELLENFQWKDNDEGLNRNLENIKDELADVLIYGVLLGDALEVDLDEIILNKLQKNVKKYPIEKSLNNKTKYTDL